MFLDLRDPQPPHEPWNPPPRRQPQLSKRNERMVLGLVGLNVLMLLLAPIAGATLLDVAIALIRAMARG
jgi:hypothetical protein